VNNEGGFVQTVSAQALEAKVGRRLNKGEEFTTATGRWRVIWIAKEGTDTYTVEKIG